MNEDVNEPDVIGILSGKGGVGKTMLVANLGTALASEFNKKVILVDGNIKTSHLGLHLGIYEELSVTLREVLLNKVPVMYAVFLHPSTGLRLLPAPMKNSVNLKKMDRIIKELKTAYDPVLVDCAPGLGREAITAAKAIDKALLVTTPDLPAVTDALKTIDLLKKLKKDILGIILNRVRNERYELSIEEIESTCGYDVICEIPETNKIPESIARGLPVVSLYPDSSVSIKLKKLAAWLVGEEYTPTGFLYTLKSLIGLVKSNEIRILKRKIIREKPYLSRKKSKFKRKVAEEIVDVEELRKEIRSEMKGELRESIKERLKKEIVKKLRERLREESE